MTRSKSEKNPQLDDLQGTSTLLAERTLPGAIAGEKIKKKNPN